MPRARGCLDDRGRTICFQTISDTRNGLDTKGALTQLLRQLTETEEDAIDRILADDPAVPALLDDLVASDDLAGGAGEDDENLHHPRFDDLREAIGLHAPCRWIDPGSAKRERGFVRQHDALAPNQAFTIPGAGHPFQLTQINALSHRLGRGSPGTERMKKSAGLSTGAPFVSTCRFSGG